MCYCSEFNALNIIYDFIISNYKAVISIIQRIDIVQVMNSQRIKYKYKYIQNTNTFKITVGKK